MDEHPFHHKIHEPMMTEKITICDLPLTFDNTEIENYLKSYPGVLLVSKIKFGNSRKPDGSFTQFLSGDRYCYAKGPIQNPLPKTIKLGTVQCRLYHRSQKEKSCKICRTEGHKELTEACPAYQPKQKETTIAFRSPMVFSNFYPANFEYNDTKFNSVEQAYQYTRAIALDENIIADEIMTKTEARDVKLISNKLKDNREWEMVRYDVMKDLISIKSQVCPEFKTALIESEDKYLAEATSNQYWASGLSPQLTENTHFEKYPGKNKLGQILMREREKITNNVKFEKEKPIQENKNINHQSRTPLKKQDNDKRSLSLPGRLAKNTQKRLTEETSKYFFMAGKRPAQISPNKDTDQKEKHAKK
jgi:ribA/ribD-fused uncharacterized protein